MPKLISRAGVPGVAEKLATMARTFIGFYDLDAAPSHGLTGDLATRLGTATETDGFSEGSVYVRSDRSAVAILIRYDDRDGFEQQDGVGVLLQAADWRSRDSDARSYVSAGTIDGDGDAASDSSFYIVQRFDTKPESQRPLVEAIVQYMSEYARPIAGFLGGEAFASLDGTRVVFVMPWAHEAALNALENRDGSLAAMQKHLRLSDRHTYGSYQRVSFLRATPPVESAVRQNAK